MTARTGYSLLQIALHWLTAIAIFGAFFTHEGMGRALNQRIDADLSGFDGATLHTALGGLAFALVAVRLAVRLRSGAPPAQGPKLVQTASKLGHKLLYALMILAPLLGALTWYGKIEALGELHEITGQALIVVALGHAIAAIFHQALFSDGTMARMAFPEKRP